MSRMQNFQVLGVLALALLLTVAMTAVYASQQTEGTIAMTDPDNHSLILVDNRNNVQSIRFLVGGEVYINDREATLWDVQAGDRAVVTYDTGNNKVLLATAIHCQRN
jgi:hypothetical protein